MVWFVRKTTCFIIILSFFLLIQNKIYAFTGSGLGTSDDPYQITTCEQLQEIADDLDANYILSGDIDCSGTSSWNSGAGFLPISSFVGTFDGKGHTISGLKINRPSTNNVGLFGSINGFSNSLSITDVKLVDVDIKGSEYVGGLVGRGTTFPLTKISVSGKVSGFRFNGGMAGGLFNVIPQETRASVDVTASGRVAGGLIGLADSNAGAENSYATGTVVTGSDSGGGLIGAITTGGVENSYATGAVTAVSAAGGLIGSMGTGDLTNSFATGLVTVTNLSNPSGGLVGNLYDSGDIINSYFDQTGTGQEDCEGTGATCTGIDTSVNPNYFKNNNSNPPLNQWNFNTIWATDASYPLLAAIDEIVVPEEEVSEDEQSDSEENNNTTSQYFSPSSSPSAPECIDKEPDGTPNLFQIDAAGTYVNIYFSATSGGTGYNVNYGLTPETNQYGDNFGYDGSLWTIGRTISDLQPNTTYYFKVQAVNGCNAGGWSNVKSIKTKGRLANITQWFANLNPFSSKQVLVTGKSITDASKGVGSCSYVVEAGDSLWKIASEQLGSGVKHTELAALNPGVGVLQIGQVILLCK